MLMSHRAECMIIHRTDAETAGYLTSAISPQDRPYILGCTNIQLRPLLATVSASSSKSKSQAEAVEDDWIASAGLSTLDEAVLSQYPSEYPKWKAVSEGQNVAEALATARTIGLGVQWDCEAARSREGWYRFRGGIESAIDRAVACAKYADILWTRTPATVEKDLEKFAKEVKERVPGAMLAYNLAGDIKGTGECVWSSTALPRTDFRSDKLSEPVMP
jgi:isocitrate lyase